VTYFCVSFATSFYLIGLRKFKHGCYFGCHQHLKSSAPSICDGCGRGVCCNKLFLTEATMGLDDDEVDVLIVSTDEEEAFPVAPADPELLEETLSLAGALHHDPLPGAGQSPAGKPGLPPAAPRPPPAVPLPGQTRRQ
jgi:hypothetical protein